MWASYTALKYLHGTVDSKAWASLDESSGQICEAGGQCSALRRRRVHMPVCTHNKVKYQSRLRLKSSVLTYFVKTGWVCRTCQEYGSTTEQLITLQEPIPTAALKLLLYINPLTWPQPSFFNIGICNLHIWSWMGLMVAYPLPVKTQLFLHPYFKIPFPKLT